MIKLFIQFPEVTGNQIFDGTKHESEPIDIVKIGNTNVYILEFMDYKLNKRSRILLQKGSREISHMPLMNKTGLNDLFDKYKKTSPVINVEEFFAHDKDIGRTATYPNIDAFLEDLSKSTKEVSTGERKQGTHIVNVDQLVVPPQRQYVVDDYRAKVAGVAAEVAGTEPEKRSEETVNSGILGFYGATKSATGPGLKINEERWERYAVPTSDRDDFEHDSFPPPPPPGGHGHRR